MSLPIGKKIVFYTLLIITAAIVFAPTVMALVMSFMSNKDIMTGSMPSVLTFDNYVKAFNQFPLLQYLFNSFLISIVIMLGQLILSSLAAYAFVFLEFKGRDMLFYLFIATMMVPFEASVIPNFHTIRDLGWIRYISRIVRSILCDGFRYIPIETELQADSERIKRSKFNYRNGRF